jgi:predicted ArsR family transcriptional regulator
VPAPHNAPASDGARAPGGRRAQGLTAAEATLRLEGLLADFGFEPEPGDDHPATHVILRHCPFLDLAETGDRIACSVHLGLMQGALAAMDAPITVTRLDPFVEPDRCVAYLEPATG